jgi:hypothetical protein
MRPHLYFYRFLLTPARPTQPKLSSSMNADGFIFGFCGAPAAALMKQAPPPPPPAPPSSSPVPEDGGIGSAGFPA